MALHSQFRQNSLRPAQSRREGGWVLLTLLLAMALLIIFAAAIVPTITFDIKRDREEEMIHRGVQYSRAIRAYYKKFGRYPTKIEDLENSNNLRFLRKRYKDPLNCKNGECADFKLLHFGEVQLSLSGLAGGNIPGANPMGMNAGLNGSPGGLSQPSTFGGNSGFGANSNSSFGQNQQTAGSGQSQPGPQVSPDETVPVPSGSGNGNSGNGNSSSNQLGSGQIIGGPIVGVASLCKDKTIREFNHKNKYKDWVFAYDPAQDQGHLITTPYQPQLQGFGQQPNINGQNNPNNGTGNPLGSSPSGLQNNPNTPMSGGFSTPNPPNTPQQQQ